MGKASTRDRLTGATLDTGALLAMEKRSTRMLAFLELAYAQLLPLAIPAGVVAQAWRGGARQARLAHLLRAPMTEVVALDESFARTVGVMCGDIGARDAVDVSVVVCARERGHRVITSDPGDIRAIDSSLTLMET